METFLISFDLSAPGRNYQAVYDYMDTFSDSIKPLQTVYLVYTAKGAGEIRDALKQCVDSNDKILVINVDPGNWGTRNLPKTSEWLNSHNH